MIGADDHLQYDVGAMRIPKILTMQRCVLITLGIYVDHTDVANQYFQHDRVAQRTA